MPAHTPGPARVLATPESQGVPNSLLPPIPAQNKSDKGRTLGCTGCELSVKVEGVIRLCHSWLEGWLDLTTVQLLQNRVGIQFTTAPPQPARSPTKEEVIGLEQSTQIGAQLFALPRPALAL